MIWRRGALEIEVEWDHGPDVSIIFYGHRTHILSASWSAYPVLAGPKDPVDPPHFFGPLDRMVKAAYEFTHDPLNEAIEEAGGVFDHDARTLEFPDRLYGLTFYPPGNEGMRRLMEELPVPEPGKRLSVKALMEAMYRAVGLEVRNEPDGREFTA